MRKVENGGEMVGGDWRTKIITLIVATAWVAADCSNECSCQSCIGYMQMHLYEQIHLIGEFLPTWKRYLNKTKVLSVQLGKTLGLTKVPITKTEESTQVRKLGLKLFWPQGGGGVIIKEGWNFGPKMKRSTIQDVDFFDEGGSLNFPK